MKKIGLIILVTLFMWTVTTGCQSETSNHSGIKVAVSVVPQKAFVEAVAGDLAEVVVMIPPGASPANYQPTPKALTDLSDSDVYFAIGVPTESVNIIPNMIEGTDLPVIYLNEAVDKVYDARYFGADEHDQEADFNDDHEDGDDEDDDHEDDDHDEHEHDGRDPHIWLSPKRVMIMVEQIRDHLVELDQDNASVYEANAANYMASLESLDQYITDQFSQSEDIDFIMMHPSLGYFADDYGLHMASVEVDGKEATAQGLQAVIDFALEMDIHVIFYQTEFDYSQAETIADAIDGDVMEVDVLSEDYIDNMKLMTDTIIEAN